MQHTLFPSARTWQRHVRYGTFKRNSATVKPAIWLYQKLKLPSVTTRIRDQRTRNFVIAEVL